MVEIVVYQQAPDTRIVKFDREEELGKAAELLLEPLYSAQEIAIIVPKFLDVMKTSRGMFASKRLAAIRATGMRLNTYLPPSLLMGPGYIGYI